MRKFHLRSFCTEILRAQDNNLDSGCINSPVILCHYWQDGISQVSPSSWLFLLEFWFLFFEAMKTRKKGGISQKRVVFSFHRIKLFLWSKRIKVSLVQCHRERGTGTVSVSWDAGAKMKIRAQSTTRILTGIKRLDFFLLFFFFKQFSHRKTQDVDGVLKTLDPPPNTEAPFLSECLPSIKAKSWKCPAKEQHNELKKS